MFLDPFTFTPPRPDVLTRAVESYQRVAAARFCRYARDAANPDNWPRRMSGDGLEPTSKQLHAEVRALRHLTAIQRTLREFGGPLFDPDSPIPPEERFHLVERRLEEIDQAFGDCDPDTDFRETSFDSHESYTSHMSYSSDPSDSSHPVNHGDPVSSSSSSFFHPPEIEDLLTAVDFAQHVFAARAELLDKRRLTLSPEDFLLEIAALRDLTAVIRTLRRMSAQPLPENESLPKDLAATACPPSSASSGFASDEESEAEEVAPTSHGSHPSHAGSPSSHPSCSSPPSPDSSESVKSVDDAASASSGFVDPLNGDAPLRPVPRVPEIRPAVARPFPDRESPGKSVSVRASAEVQASPAASFETSKPESKIPSDSPHASDPPPPSDPASPSREGSSPSSSAPPEPLILRDSHPPPSEPP